MTDDKREIQRKLRVLLHAEKIGSVSKVCRYFGIARLMSLTIYSPGLLPVPGVWLIFHFLVVTMRQKHPFSKSRYLAIGADLGHWLMKGS